MREAGSVQAIGEFVMPATIISRIVNTKRTRSYSGIKAVIPAEQDGCATESMGPIYDRTQEHLGYSDKTIIALRKVLLASGKKCAGGTGAPASSHRPETQRLLSPESG